MSTPRPAYNPYALFAVGVLLCLDVLMLVLHWRFGWEYEFFNLDREHNLPTSYQGLKYIVLATASFAVALTAWLRPVAQKFYAKFWVLLWVLFAFLSLDEMGQLHENIERHATDLIPGLQEFLQTRAFDAGWDGASWILFYAAAGLLLLPLALYMAYFAVRCLRPHWLFVGLGLVMVVFGAAGLEFLSTSGQSNYNTTMLFEEGLEMLGISTAAVFVFEELARRSELLLKKLT